jgi:hypothetical protein
MPQKKENCTLVLPKMVHSYLPKMVHCYLPITGRIGICSCRLLINNWVVAFHFGFEGSIQKWDFILKTSYSLNYGTFGTSRVGHMLGKIRTLPLNGIFSETKQLSTYLLSPTQYRFRKNSHQRGCHKKVASFYFSLFT